MSHLAQRRQPAMPRRFEPESAALPARWRLGSECPAETCPVLARNVRGARALDRDLFAATLVRIGRLQHRVIRGPPKTGPRRRHPPVGKLILDVESACVVSIVTSMSCDLSGE